MTFDDNNNGFGFTPGEDQDEHADNSVPVNQSEPQPEPESPVLPQAHYQPPEPQPEQPVTLYYAPPGVHYAHPETPKKRGKGRRIIAAVLAFTLLFGAIGTVASLYEINPTEGGFTVTRRTAETDPLYAQGNPSVAPSDSGYSLQGSGSANGPSLTITPTQTTNSDSVPNGELTLQQIAAKCTPTAVGIVAMSESPYYGSATSTGTGVIMSSDGYIITNNHVVDSATSISVTLYDGREFEATLIGKDSRSDLAVLKISASGLTAAEFGDSDAMVVGDAVVAIGNPLGLDFMGTVTDGILSAINRDVVVEERTMTLLQTNAAINSGNSGGPLFNMYGQVIGIVNSKMQSYSTTVEGLGFAIPTGTVKEIVDELIQYGYIKGWPAIGINHDNVTERMSQYYNIPRGVMVSYVHPHSNAYAAGLQVNDIIVEADGQTVENDSQLSRVKEQFRAGESFTVKVFRYATKSYHDITFVLNDEAELSALDTARLIP